MQTLELPKWKSHKVVSGFKITELAPSQEDTGMILRGVHDDKPIEVHVSNQYVMRFTPSVGHYYVRYEDGYESLSPADAWEKGYLPVGTPVTISDSEIREIFLRHGFKTKEQPGGTVDLNPYVYDAARALLNYVNQQ